MRGPAFCFVAATIAFTITSSAFAALEFDQSVNPDIIFGSGNANGGFTTNDPTTSNIELGIRAKIRFPTPLNQFNSNGDGTYSFATGTGGATFPRPLWNFEWSINTDFSGTGGTFLDDLVYQLRIDYDPTAGTGNYQTFDPINVALADHGIGTNSTANGAGDDDIPVTGLNPDGRTAAEYAALIAGNNVAQNSWSMSFFDDALHVFDPNVDGTYTIQLAAYGARGLLLAETSVDVIVGAGGAAVPEPLSFLTWGGLVGCAVVAARRYQRS